MSAILQASRVRSCAATDTVPVRAIGVRLPPPRFLAFCAYCERARKACLDRPCATRAERIRTVKQYDRAAKIERCRYRALSLGMSNLGWSR